ncbi:hypothetical protein OKA04_12705 [Luteolibacter flavescens]|uniref:Ribbon-helix-helix protein CopG domain-containing protein n=1 Tax=Luteolibacter flavescens TaxID=1859460 RepID=A0ABT3FQT6_9BACT|nr:hypothetical protein [Luteolibacter flavescens]MCW1885591.1 hypothetical protein [Luteolibacter flavescens]
MKLNVKTSVTLTNDEVAILDATASRMGISRNQVVRHLIIYHGLCGGDFPLTTKILALPSQDRQRVISEIRVKAESEDPPKPQGFRQWVKEALVRDDTESIERGAEALLRDLLGKQRKVA